MIDAKNRIGYFWRNKRLACSVALTITNIDTMKICYSRCLAFCLVLAFQFLATFGAYADGSKDLYPSGALGARAFLMSSANTTTAGWPFLQVATHYVYAEVGETVAAASSAQGITYGLIRLTAPDGMVYESAAGSTIGRIENRTQELAGPNVGAVTTGYTPFTQSVGTGQSGLWKVELLPTRLITASASGAGVGGTANADRKSTRLNSSH